MASDADRSADGDRTIRQVIEARKYDESTTPIEERNRCPECYRVDINQHTKRDVGHSKVESGEWRCYRCGAVFDEPATGIESREVPRDG